jgi:hypothetical protein
MKEIIKLYICKLSIGMHMTNEEHAKYEHLIELYMNSILRNLENNNRENK